MAKLLRQTIDQESPQAWEGSKADCKGVKKNLGTAGALCPSVVLITQWEVFVQTHRTVHEDGELNAHKLYSNKK